jgi:hypothetical protein
VHDFFKKYEDHKLLFAKYLLALLLIWVIIEPIANYPYYLSYFNQLAGGPKNGYHYATDSNADWGQDLKRLKNWINKYNNCAQTISHEQCIGLDILKEAQNKPIEKIRLNYFGGGNPKYYLGDIFIDWWDSKRPVEAGWYAVSVNQLQGSIYDTRTNLDGTMKKPDDESWRWIMDYPPIYQVGTSILVYYIPE